MGSLETPLETEQLKCHLKCLTCYSYNFITISKTYEVGIATYLHIQHAASGSVGGQAVMWVDELKSKMILLRWSLLREGGGGCLKMR